MNISQRVFCCAVGAVAALILAVAGNAVDGRPILHAAENNAAVAHGDNLAAEAVRRLAPWAMISVNPQRQLAETFSTHDIVELLAVDAGFEWAKSVVFRHDVYSLDFKFKPVRMIWVDIPQPSGKMQRKLIWYMVYCVTNNGKTMRPVQNAALPYQTAEDKKVFQVEYVDEPVRFIPHFVLEGRYTLRDDDGPSLVYRSQIIPLALEAIRMREDPERRFYNTADICGELAVGETRWGIATWEDVDLRIKRFSVYVQGLTNAYKWRDTPGEYKAGDRIGKGRRLLLKTLKINFWRPGDEYFPHEGEIRYGVPGELDYQWVYR